MAGGTTFFFEDTYIFADMPQFISAKEGVFGQGTKSALAMRVSRDAFLPHFFPLGPKRNWSSIIDMELRGKQATADYR